MFQILYLLTTLLPAPTKVTCSCMPIFDSVGNVIKQDYNLIFKGTVEKIDTTFYVAERLLKANYSTRDGGMYFTGFIVSLNVNTIYKGDKFSKKIRIMTGIEGGDCGYPFQTGKNYIVYANQQSYILIDSFNDESRNNFKSHDEVLFETDICTGTTLDVKKEDAILRKKFNKN